MRQMSARGVRRLTTRWEGFLSCPYYDQLGHVWTRGYGETQGISQNSACVTKHQARQELRHHMNQVYAPAVRHLIRDDLYQGEFDGFCDFTYNEGAGSLEGSTLRERINSSEGNTYRKRKKIYRQELPKWDVADGHHVQGLLNRRKAEIRYMCHSFRPHGPRGGRAPSKRRAVA